MDIRVLETHDSPREPVRPSGDRITVGRTYIGVLDGATPKARKFVEDIPADAWAAAKVAGIIEAMPAYQKPEAFVEALTIAYKVALQEAGFFMRDPNLEVPYLGGMIVISRKHGWLVVVGDGIYRINAREVPVTKLIDRVHGGMATAERMRYRAGGVSIRDILENDPGWPLIFPRLAQQMRYANKANGHKWAYSCLNGWPVPWALVRTERLKPGDRVAIATDGFDFLKENLKATLKAQRESYRKDPLRTKTLATKLPPHKGGQHDDQAAVWLEVV